MDNAISHILRQVRNLSKDARTFDKLVIFLADAIMTYPADMHDDLMEAVCNAIEAQGLIYTPVPPPTAFQLPVYVPPLAYPEKTHKEPEILYVIWLFLVYAFSLVFWFASLGYSGSNISLN